MNCKIKIEIDGDIVRIYCWEKSWWIFGRWIPYFNSLCGDSYNAWVKYQELCNKIGIIPYASGSFTTTKNF